MLISQCHFYGSPFKLMGPLLGSFGPLKSMGPGVIIPPAPPLGNPADANCFRSTKYVSKLVKDFLEEPLQITEMVSRDISSKCWRLVGQTKMFCWQSGHRPQL